MTCQRCETLADQVTDLRAKLAEADHKWRDLEKRLADAEEAVKVERSLSERLATAMRGQLARWNDNTMIDMSDALEEYDVLRKAQG